MRAVISVVGKDQVGILAKVSNECANANANVLEVTQTILQDMFVMVMLVEMDEAKDKYINFRNHLEDFGKAINLAIHVKNEEIFNAMHRI